MSDILPDAVQRRLVARAQAGDRDALDRVILANRRTACRFANRAAHRFGVDADELVQAALLAVWNAVRRFDLGRTEARFNTYATRCVLNAIAQAARREARCLARHRTGQELGDMRTIEPDVQDDPAAHAAARTEASRLLRDLSPRQRLVVRLRFGLDGADALGSRGTAAALGVTQQAVQYTLRRAYQAARGGRSPTPGQREAVTVHRQRVAAMRGRGASLRGIADEIGVGRNTVRLDLDKQTPVASATPAPRRLPLRVVQAPGQPVVTPEAVLEFLRQGFRLRAIAAALKTTVGVVERRAHLLFRRGLLCLDRATGRYVPRAA